MSDAHFEMYSDINSEIHSFTEIELFSSVKLYKRSTLSTVVLSCSHSNFYNADKSRANPTLTVTTLLIHFYRTKHIFTLTLIELFDTRNNMSYISRSSTWCDDI